MTDENKASGGLPIKTSAQTKAAELFNAPAAQVAYDYEKQEWVSGETARLLMISRLEQHLAELQGPKGAQYAGFLGLNWKLSVECAEAQIAALQKAGVEL